MISRLLEAPRNRVIFIYILTTLVLALLAFGFMRAGVTSRVIICQVYFMDPTYDYARDLSTLSRLGEWQQKGALVFNPPGSLVPFPYFPSACFLIGFFANLHWHRAMMLAGAVALPALIIAVVLSWELGKDWLAQIALAVAIATSHPFAFLFQWGQIEGFLWLPVVAGIYCFLRQRYWAAAIFIALGASVKPFPILLLLLLIPKRRYREFLAGCAALLVFWFSSLSIIGPTFPIALREWLRGFQLWSATYAKAYHIVEMGADHSLFSLFKQMLRLSAGWVSGELLTPKIEAFFPWYVLICALIFVVTVHRLRKMPILNQIFGLSVIIVLLSPANNDYTLIQMYIPWAMLLLALSRRTCALPFEAAGWLMACCAVLFTPQCYMLTGASGSLGGQAKTVALLAILVLSCLYPLDTDQRELTEQRWPSPGNQLQLRSRRGGA